MKRPLWEKLFMILSAMVIGVLANIFRIAVTGVVHELISPELALKMFHDFAGLLLMPMALLLVIFEMYLLSKVLVETGPSRPLPVQLKTSTSASK